MRTRRAWVRVGAGIALVASLAAFASYWIAQSYLRPATGYPSLPEGARDEIVGGTPTWGVRQPE